MDICCRHLYEDGGDNKATASLPVLAPGTSCAEDPESPLHHQAAAASSSKQPPVELELVTANGKSQYQQQSNNVSSPFVLRNSSPGSGRPSSAAGRRSPAGGYSVVANGVGGTPSDYVAAHHEQIRSENALLDGEQVRLVLGEPSVQVSRHLGSSNGMHANECVLLSTSTHASSSPCMHVAASPATHGRHSLVKAAAEHNSYQTSNKTAVAALQVIEEEDEELVLSKAGCFIWLALITVAISVLSDYIMDAITEASVQLKIPMPFLTTIIVPIVGNAAEHASALIFAVKNRMEISLGVAVGECC